MTVEVDRSALRKVVVSVDPAVSVSEESDETGIVVVARGPHQPDTCKLTVHCPGHGYVLDDRSVKAAPAEWARRVVRAYDEWQEDLIVAEVNQGGDMVGETVRAVRGGLPYETVHASRGKRTRAEPVATLFDQGRVHMLGSFPKLEDQMITWQPDTEDSPDRVDALTHGIVALGLIGGQGMAFLTAWKADAAKDRPVVAPRELRQMPRLGEGAIADMFGRTSPRSHEHRYFGPEGLCVHCGEPRPD